MLMESSADTARIIRNMKRTGAYLGFPEEQLGIYINFKTVTVNFSSEEYSFTKMKRCGAQTINMTVIEAISKLTWRAIKEDLTIEQFEEQLDLIQKKKRNYTPWEVAIGGGLACGGFCIQFGCDWTAFFYTAIAALLGFRLKMWLGKKGNNEYLSIGVAATAATILAWLSSFLSLNATLSALLPECMHSNTPWHPLMACTLFIVPGVPLINFVSDMLEGWVQNGLTRAVRTLMILIAMAFGIALAIRICGIDNFAKNLDMIPHNSYISYAIAAALSAMGFSMIFNIQRRLLWVVALGGIIAVCTRNFVALGASTGNVGLDMGTTIGSLAGATIVSLLASQAIHLFHTPHHCLSIPSVIPMIPGVLMYRALFAFIDMHGIIGEVTVAMNNAITASLIILCIAIGIAIPNIFIKSLTLPQRKRKLLALLTARKEKHDEFIKTEKL